ncbi:MAG: nitroreductase family deazaflavin-dependent oxidoreductase [Streptomycetaceae bacterium]|nr:nitroreductase family deazaflavin-dependent oxidoreductase [Streptomycetaceae bacterium]
MRRYRETGGAVGHAWNGATCLVLTTTGRRSGEPRDTPLIYARDGDAYIVVASNGGADRHPAWYLNLLAQPRVEVQVLARRFAATAETAEGGERERLWRKATEVWPNYDAYTRRTDRTIPLVVLRPVAS